MFSRTEDSFHPFSHYTKGRVQSYGGSHYLRKYPNVLWVMTDLEKDSFTATRRVCNGYRVNEYEMSIEEIDEFKSLLETQKDLDKLRQEKLHKIQSPLKGVKSVDFKSYEAVTVLQHEYAVTKADYSQPVLGTFGAGPCVILALYDHENKTAVLAHIDALTDIDSLQRLFSSISKESTVAHLAGGDFSSQEMCMDIIELLEKNNIKIVNSDIARSSFDSASFAIDARTGKVYSPVRHDQLHKTSDIDMRLQLAGLQFGKSPIKECYKGSKLIAPIKKDSPSIDESVSLTTSLSLPQAKTLTLGFLKPGNKQNQKDNYCGFKSGFLIGKSF
jgi:hypothetical protein